MVLTKCNENCEGCPFLADDQEGKRHKYVSGISLNCERPRDARLLVFAEGPALNEVLSGRPLAPKGSAGRVFAEHTKAVGLDTIPMYLANVVMCSNLTAIPRGRKWKTHNPPPEAWTACTPHWQSLVREVNPEVILLLGKIPMHVFGIGDFEKDELISIMEGNPFTIIDCPPKVVLTYHPSGLKGRKKRIDLFQKHLKIVFDLLL